MTVTSYPEVGARLPSMRLTSMDGQSVDLGAFSGKRHILFMWASW